jgi:hypothetical protein
MQRAPSAGAHRRAVLHGAPMAKKPSELVQFGDRPLEGERVVIARWDAV